MKPTSVLVSHQEGGHSTKGTSYLLEGQKYIHCTRYMSYSKRVTCSWLISLCHRYGMDNSDTSARPTSHIYLEPDISPNSPSPIISSASIGSTTNRYSHPTSTPKKSSPLDLVHSDVYGPMPHQSLGGALYFINFIDDSTRKVWAYPIFFDWLTMVEKKSGRKLKFLRTDNRGEFIYEAFVQFVENATFDVNIRHPIVWSIMDLSNE